MNEEKQAEKRKTKREEKWLENLLLTRENRLQLDTYIVFAPGDYGFDAPFGVPSSDCGQTKVNQMSNDPIDESFVDFSNCILLPI